jgi:hypothetical protein
VAAAVEAEMRMEHLETALPAKAVLAAVISRRIIMFSRQEHQYLLSLEALVQVVRAALAALGLEHKEALVTLAVLQALILVL